MNSITALIPTLGRPDSLAITLSSLATDDRHGCQVDAIVIDNGDDPGSREAVAAANRAGLPTSYVRESRRGKSHCLNRGMDQGPRGDIIAVIDDDLTLERGWVRGVMAITHRWPRCGFYTGRSYIIWPTGVMVPPWANHPAIRSWAYSVMGSSSSDKPIEPGRWASGNHFWVRREVMAGRRFHAPTDLSLDTHIEMAEPRLMMDLTESGLPGVMGPEAVAGHRIQAELLDPDVIRRRASRVGRGFAEARVRPWRRSSKQAEYLRSHPRLGRYFSLLAMLGWKLALRVHRSRPSSDGGLVAELHAIERHAFYGEILHWSRHMPEYAT